ncbi:glycoside hydrolase family 99-like domain-containing protein [Arcanobacterium pinnipediorum]|uniref:Glycoside hydrolase family 99-like domain-containing protein n=1 Tax=Arcanobacterium pinnipediorum TaxID=1503041 RepID=A0ABY5AGY2_9ACTO|nr:glycoside hydrolase family 99-like domain-containing protein [Arcanobacterium pinnipediorum]USR79457.1 glycoside hydrolase family 99-like domain-containing protein [Arcanobacterium pinnipediorum]
MRKITKAGAKRRLLEYQMRGRQMLAQAIETGELPRRNRNILPSDFTRWVGRFDGRRNQGFPDVWRTNHLLPFENPAKVGVVIHVYYRELLDEIVLHLKNIPVEFDVIITNASGENIDEASIKNELDNLINIAVLEVDNHGRDILPLIHVVNAGFVDPYELIFKVHTKKSQWRANHESLGGDGESWKKELLSGLLGSRDQVAKILDFFAANPHAGMMTVEGNIVGAEHWGGDKKLVTELLKRLEMNLEAPDELQFPAGSIYVARGFVVQGLRALCMSAEDFEVEAGQIDGTAAHAIERMMGILTLEAGLELADTSALDAEVKQGWMRFAHNAPRSARATAIPFYLPQFHPNTENDRWWGTGFTEWTNVTAAAPVFLGHHQPRHPADLGFYDLRLDEVRQQQQDLAQAHAIAGFMYYYYWFSGQRLLNLPIEKLKDSEVNTPFCFMWANENWTRSWDGRHSDILVGQDYSTVPAELFIEDIMEFLLDERYIRVDGKAVIAVYRPAQMDNFADVVHTWRRRARQAGVGELMVLAVEVSQQFDGVGDNWRQLGLDGTLMFPPHNLTWEGAALHKYRPDRRFKGRLLSYRGIVRQAIRKIWTLDSEQYPGVMVTFDNTARRQWKSDIWWGSNPYTFHRWLLASVDSVMDRDPEHRIVFINAWNEWAEGAVLEPTARHGKTYLQAVRNVMWS